MRGILLKLTAAAPLALLLGISPAVSQQQSQSDPVADAARKAREKQQNSPKPKKVYTDDDIPHRNDATTPAPGAAAASGDDANKAAADGDDSKLTPEQKWRKRFADQRAKIAKAEQELDILQKEENKAELQYYPDPQKALKEQYTRKDINEKAAKIDAKKKEIEALKQQMSDMEDELRKAGGDPGWAR